MLNKKEVTETMLEIIRLKDEISTMDIKLQSMIEKLNNSAEYKAVESQRNGVEAMQDDLTMLEKKYKDMMVEDYKSTPEELRTKQYPGVSISERISYQYDNNKIIPWLREKGHEQLIKEDIDKTKVKKLADVLDVPGVDVSVTISSSWKGSLDEVDVNEYENLFDKGEIE